ncbi:hypothetical protein [Singulisphaera sp. PoT]|uniref:hypothetical protein n=1 Tax=Singulisphaera sp. PoT TaxID=3411797 RepID=UPI003BF5D2CA
MSGFLSLSDVGGSTIQATAPWVEDARRRLKRLQRDDGAWCYRHNATPAVEPTALAGLALLATDSKSRSEPDREAACAAARRLAAMNSRNGSLGVTTGLVEPGWATPAAILLWSALGEFEPQLRRAIDWLLSVQGVRTAKTKDDPMGHDPTIVGWSWAVGTHSWVEPTALSILALNRVGKGGHARVAEGFRLLRDRAIPTGGWNYGNPVAFGTPLRALPAPTSLALLALATTGQPESVARTALKVLQPILGKTRAPVSLGWSMLSLRAWGASPEWASEALEASYERPSTQVDPLGLALLLLAEGARSLELFGLPSRSTEVAHV